MSPETPRLQPCYDISEKVDPQTFPHLYEMTQARKARQGYDFSPELYKDVEAFCTTEAFWEEFHHDVNQAAIRFRPSLANFFGSYDASTGRFLQKMDGKYADLHMGHFLREDLHLDAVPREERSQLETYVLFRIPLPEDNPRLATLMRESRNIVRDNFSYLPYFRDRFTRQEFEDPAFWQSFAEDVRSLDRDVPFDEFLKHYGGEYWEADTYEPWTAPSGKYETAYRFLEKKKTRGGGTKRDKEYLREWADPLLVHAPDDLKTDIDVRFFAEVSEVAVEEALRGYGFPEALLPAVKRFGNLREDIQPEVINNVASILARNAKIRVPQARALLTHYVNEDGLVEEPTLLTTISETTAFIQYKNDYQQEGQVIYEIPDAFIEHYAKPLTREELFKEASAHWYEQKGNLTGEQIQEYMQDFWQNKITTVVVTEPETTHVLQTEVNQLGNRLLELVELRNRITYFQSTIQGGQPTFLFLHQLDGIQRLLEQKGGIYADEAGLGKTLTVGIAAFLLTEQNRNEELARAASTPWHKRVMQTGIVRGLLGRGKEAEKPSIDRVLVVGSKAVIDNWQKEIGIHTKGIDVVNLTFSSEEAETGMIPSLSERKFRFFQQVREAGTNPQLLLVHYDVFRDADFVARLGKLGIRAVAIDEAHNVKTGVLSVLSESVGDVKTVAKRTQGLYQFLETLDGSVIFATGTPFVKNLREPLVMAHVVDRDLVPLASIARASKNPSETNRLLEPLMIRHLKKDVAGLPEKSVAYVRIPYDSLGESDIQYIQRELDRIDRQTQGNPGERFFSQLNLEIQAKLPWLTEEVRRIQDDGRKVVIFTPFVHGEKTLTKDSSTVAVAGHLHEAGIEGVAVLDSTLSPMARLLMQDQFRQKGGAVKMLVASEGIGGEGITLSSFENRATHVIVLVPPTSLARFLQIIDRIHRFGQPEDVTVLVPFVEGFDNQQTYDQRLVASLREELTTFEQAIDGRFSINRDLYQEVGGIFSGSRLFTKETMENRASVPSSGVIFNARVLGEGSRPPRREYTIRQDPEEEEVGEVPAYLKTELRSLPLGLSRQQLELAYKYMQAENGLQSLMQDPLFQETLETGDDQMRRRVTSAIGKSGTVAEFVLHSNLSLVRHIARKFSTTDSIMDLMQEGNITLMRVIQSYNPSKGQFSSYAGTSLFRRFVSIVKKEREHEEVSLDMTPEGQDARTLLDRTPDTSVGVEDEVVTDDFTKRLQERLSPRQWQVVSLLMEGFNESEIARSLGTSRQNIDSVIKTVKRRIPLSEWVK